MGTLENFFSWIGLSWVTYNLLTNLICLYFVPKEQSAKLSRWKVIASIAEGHNSKLYFGVATFFHMLLGLITYSAHWYVAMQLIGVNYLIGIAAGSAANTLLRENEEEVRKRRQKNPP